MGRENSLKTALVDDALESDKYAQEKKNQFGLRLRTQVSSIVRLYGTNRPSVGQSEKTERYYQDTVVLDGSHIRFLLQSNDPDDEKAGEVIIDFTARNEHLAIKNDGKSKLKIKKGSGVDRKTTLSQLRDYQEVVTEIAVQAGRKYWPPKSS